MSARSRTALHDPELVDLLRGEPDLLAVADAVASTQRVRPPRRPLLAGAFVAAIFLLAVGLLAVERGGPSLTDRALAAIGNGQVIHVVARWDSPEPTLVDLATGREQATRYESELWFDRTRDLERTITRVNGVRTDEELQTPQGIWDNGSRVWTCAYIAAHPVEATKARVSCNASGDNGTTPRHVAEPRPALDPALAAFATGYRAALASGAAHVVHKERLDGRDVLWIEFPLKDGGAERVAIDRLTLKPVRLRTLDVHGTVVADERIALIETVGRVGVSFAKPPLAPSQPTSGSVLDPRTVKLAEAAQALPGLLSPGASVGGHDLARVELDRVTVGYGRDSGRAPTSSAGVQIDYGDRLVVKEAPQALAYGFGRAPVAPPDGFVLLNRVMAAGGNARDRWQGLLRRGGLEVVLDASDRSLLLQAARALAPVIG